MILFVDFLLILWLGGFSGFHSFDRLFNDFFNAIIFRKNVCKIRRNIRTGAFCWRWFIRSILLYNFILFDCLRNLLGFLDLGRCRRSGSKLSEICNHQSIIPQINLNILPMLIYFDILFLQLIGLIRRELNNIVIF